MTTTYGNAPMGLRELKVAAYATPATIVKLPNAIEMTVEDRVQSAELLGDDAIQDVSSRVQAATIKLSAGGISLEALAILTGRTPVESGTTPNRYKTAWTAAGGQYPYFIVWGRALGTGSDDTYIKVFKCKLTKFIGGQLKDGAFLMSDSEGIAVPDPVAAADHAANTIYFVAQDETATALPS